MSLITPHRIRQLRTKLCLEAKQSSDFRFCATGVNCVRLWVNSIGEPDAANLHVRFDERGAETERWYGLRHRRVAKAAGYTTAPFLMPPRRPSTLPRQPRARMTGRRLGPQVKMRRSA